MGGGEVSGVVYGIDGIGVYPVSQYVAKDIHQRNGCNPSRDCTVANYRCGTGFRRCGDDHQQRASGRRDEPMGDDSGSKHQLVFVYSIDLYICNPCRVGIVRCMECDGIIFRIICGGVFVEVCRTQLAEGTDMMEVRFFLAKSGEIAYINKLSF